MNPIDVDRFLVNNMFPLNHITDEQGPPVFKPNDYTRQMVQKPVCQSAYPFSGTNLFKCKPTKQICVIDSRDRDYAKYPTPDKYTVVLPQVYKNVSNIRLKMATIPKTEYNVNVGNNVIEFREASLTSPILKATLQKGQYQISGLLDEVKSKMEAAGTGTYSVTLANGTGSNSTPNNRIVITRTDGPTFQLVLTNAASPYRLLGFQKEITVLGTTFTGIYDYNMLDFPKYVNLSLSNTKFFNNRVDSTGTSLDKIYTTLPFDGSLPDVIRPDSVMPGEMVAFRTYTFDDIAFNLPIPEGKVGELNISFTTYGGFAYDFHNREHMIVLEFDIQE